MRYDYENSTGSQDIAYIEGLEDRVEELEADINKETGTYFAVEEAQEKAERAEKRAEFLMFAIENQQAEIGHLREGLDRAYKTIEDLRHDVSVAVQERDGLKRKLKDEEKRYDGLSMRNKDLHDKNDRLVRAARENLDEIENLKSVIADLRRISTIRNAKTDGQTTEITAMQKLIDQQVEEIDRRMDENGQQSRENNLLKVKLSHANSVIRDMSNAFAAADDYITELDDEEN